MRAARRDSRKVIRAATSRVNWDPLVKTPLAVNRPRLRRVAVMGSRGTKARQTFCEPNQWAGIASQGNP